MITVSDHACERYMTRVMSLIAPKPCIMENVRETIKKQLPLAIINKLKSGSFTLRINTEFMAVIEEDSTTSSSNYVVVTIRGK